MNGSRVEEPALPGARRGDSTLAEPPSRGYRSPLIRVKAGSRLPGGRFRAHFDTDLEHEPERIRRFYDIQRSRVEPAGLMYPWPETN